MFTPFTIPTPLLFLFLHVIVLFPKDTLKYLGDTPEGYEELMLVQSMVASRKITVPIGDSAFGTIVISLEQVPSHAFYVVPRRSSIDMTSSSTSLVQPLPLLQKPPSYTQIYNDNNGNTNATAALFGETKSCV
jgi:hypothetical protein